MAGSGAGSGSSSPPTHSQLAEDEEDRRVGVPDEGVWLLLAAGVMSGDKRPAPVFSGRPYHDIFPNYVCMQTSAAGKLCNAEWGGEGGRAGGGGPTLHPAALGPSQRSCSPRGAVLPAADGLHHRHRSPPPPATARASALQPMHRGTAAINGLFVKCPDQNAYIRHPGNLITEPGFTPHAHTPFFFEASVRSPL